MNRLAITTIPAIVVLQLSSAMAATTAPSSRPSPLVRDQIDQLVRPLIEQDYIRCMVVGTIDPANGARIFGYGQVADGDDRVPNGDTIFEIGSVSKVFTSLLLADMVQRGLVRLDDPIQKLLPDSIHLAQAGNRPITLLDLSTHRSGFPRLPDNFDRSNLENPYSLYSVENLYSFLNHWQPPRPPGDKAEYSNLGAGLLAHLLARRASTTYGSLLQERILAPLGMSKSSITLTDRQARALAQPHDPDGRVATNWTFTEALVGAGGIRSTAGDMLRFLQAQLHPPAGDLGEAIRLSQRRQNQFDAANAIGLGWIISNKGFIWHNGATGAYHSFVAFSPEHQTAIAVLANNASGWTDSIGQYLICLQIGAVPAPLPSLRTIVKLDGTQLQRLTGDYLVGLSVLSIRLKGDQLTAQMSGQPELRIYPESETRCFWKAADAQADFVFEPDDARAQRLVLHQAGHNIPSPRLATTRPGE